MTKAERQEIFEELEKTIVARYPKTKIKYKESHWFWKKLPGKWRTYATTLGNTIWMAKNNYAIRTLGHEYCHLEDSKEDRFRFLGFYNKYLNPQIGSLRFLILSAWGFFCGWPVVSTVLLAFGLILLAPWMSSSRSKLETKGYKMSIYIKYLEEGEISKEYHKKIVDNLASWLYYKMIWRRDNAEDIVDAMCEDIINNNGKPPKDSVAFADVHRIFNEKTRLFNSRSRGQRSPTS